MPKRNFLQLRGEIFTSEYSNAVVAKSAVKERQHNSEHNTCNICNPILHIRAAPKGGLEDLNDAAIGAGAKEDGDQAKAVCARQRKGQCCKGNQMHDFIAAIWTRRRLIDRPKHRHCQYSRYDECERNVEVLAHVNRLKALGSEHKEKLCFERFAVKAKKVNNHRLGGSDK